MERKIMTDEQQKAIAEEYQEFVNLARKLADEDESLYLHGKRDTKMGLDSKQERFKEHVLDMLSMFAARYGQKENRYQTAWGQLRAYFMGQKNLEVLKAIELYEYTNRLDDCSEYLKESKKVME